MADPQNPPATLPAGFTNWDPDPTNPPATLPADFSRWDSPLPSFAAVPRRAKLDIGAPPPTPRSVPTGQLTERAEQRQGMPLVIPPGGGTVQPVPMGTQAVSGPQSPTELLNVAARFPGTQPTHVPRNIANVPPLSVPEMIGGATDILAPGTLMPGGTEESPGQQVGRGIQEMETPGQRTTGALRTGVGLLNATAPLAGPFAAENPGQAVLAGAAGYGAGKAARFGAQQAGATPEQQNLTENLGQAAGALGYAGLNPEIVQGHTPEGNPAIEGRIAGRYGGGVEIAPNEYVVRYGDVANPGEMRIPRRPGAAGLQEPTIQGETAAPPAQPSALGPIAQRYLTQPRSTAPLAEPAATAAAATPAPFVPPWSMGRATPPASAPSREEAVSDFMGKSMGRLAQEAEGQGVLDDMSDQGISPKDVSRNFWADTYFRLPPQVQQKFRNYLQSETGFKPGGTIAFGPNREAIPAQDWQHIAETTLDLPDDPEHLEGTTRGLVALMKVANDRFGVNSPSTQPIPSQLPQNRPGPVPPGQEGQTGIAGLQSQAPTHRVTAMGATMPIDPAMQQLNAARNMSTTVDNGDPDASGRPTRAVTVHLDDDAMRFLELAGAGKWGGISHEVGEGLHIAEQLRNFGAHMQSIGEPQAADNVNRLARQIETAAVQNQDPFDPNSHAGIPVAYTPRSVLHESETHGAQRAMGFQSSINDWTNAQKTLQDPASPGQLHPVVQKMLPQLQTLASPTAPAMAAEAENYILDGDHARLGIDVNDAVTYIQHALDVLSEHQGQERMANLPQLARRHVQSMRDYLAAGGPVHGRAFIQPTAPRPAPTPQRGATVPNPPGNAPAGPVAEGGAGPGSRALSAGTEQPQTGLRFRSPEVEPLYSRVPKNPEEARISPRNPTGAKSAEDPLKENLQINTQAILDSPPGPSRKGIAARPPAEVIADLLRKYPGMAKALQGLNTEQTLEAFKRESQENLLYVHDGYVKAFPNEAKESSKWYDGAQALSLKKWPKEYGTNYMQTASGISALSPGKDWFMNVSMEKRIIEAMLQQKELRYTPKMAKMARTWMEETPKEKQPKMAELLNEVKGKRLADLTDALHKAVWIKLYDEAEGDPSYEVYAPDGTVLGKAMTKEGEEAKLAWTTWPFIVKAVSLFEDHSRENIHQQLGEAHKIRSFYNNQIAPNSRSGDVTIDTHAVGADQLRAFAQQSDEVKDNFGGAPGTSSAQTGVQGSYGVHADAYRGAADERDLLARQMQSMTWDQARSLFPRSFKTETNKGIIDQIWKDYDSGKISTKQEARDAILKFAGGWKAPDWATYQRQRSGRTVDEGTQRAGNPGELSGAGTTRKQAGRAVSGGRSTAAAGAPGSERITSASPVLPPQIRRIARPNVSKKGGK